MSAHLHFLKVILCLKDWVWCVSAGLHFKKKKKKVQANNELIFLHNPSKQFFAVILASKKTATKTKGSAQPLNKWLRIKGYNTELFRSIQILTLSRPSFAHTICWGNFEQFIFLHSLSCSSLSFSS